MNKKILFGKTARQGVKEGIDIVANAVKVTLGYGGRTVIISNAIQSSRATKDGVTVAREIELKDNIQNAGAKIVKEVAEKTVQVVGDGTTTVCVLIQELVSRGLELVDTGANPVLLKKGMDRAAKIIVEHLKSLSTDIGDNYELLKQVATVSANNDPEIGGIVGSVFEKIGKYGIVTFEDSKTPETYIEVVKGFKFGSGFFSHYFINDHSKNIYESENPYVLVIEQKVSKTSEIAAILELCAQQKRPLVIIAEDFDFNTIGVISRNNQSKVLNACLVKYNLIGEAKEDLMLDICAMSGATLVTEKTGKKMENIQLSDLGEAEKIVCTQNDTTIIQGKQSEKQVTSRIEDAKVKVENATNQWMKDKHEQRLAKLQGSIAVCYIGGSTEFEVSEKKDRIEDAVKATQAAIEEGVLPGGGVSLLRCAENVLKQEVHSIDEKDGIGIVALAICCPLKQILFNAGLSDGVAYKAVASSGGNIGYNVKTEKIEDLVAAGIIDPIKVVRVCVENAVSAAAQVIISEALIVNDND